METHQIRPSGETKWYAPARDITCFTPVAIHKALEAWEDPNNIYKQLGTSIRLYTDDDVQKICEALAAFCSKECIIDTDTYVQAFEKSGLGDVPFHLRMVVMALIGEQFLSAFWFGIRGATTKSQDEDGFDIQQYDPEALAQESQKLCRLLRMPRWKRRLYVWWDSLRRRLVERLNREN